MVFIIIDNNWGNLSLILTNILLNEFYKVHWKLWPSDFNQQKSINYRLGENLIISFFTI